MMKGRQQQKMEMCTDHINKNSYNQFWVGDWGEWRLGCAVEGECIKVMEKAATERERKRQCC